MQLVIVDKDEKVITQYDHQKVKELLVKYTEILKDVGKAFDQLSEDLMDKARNK